MKRLLYYRALPHVPAEGGTRQEVLRWHCNDRIAGHFGAHCILELVTRKYHWPSMLRNVKAYTKACSMCQRIRTVQYRPHGTTEPLPQLRNL